MKLVDEIAEAIARERYKHTAAIMRGEMQEPSTDSYNKAFAQAAIDVVERRLLSDEVNNVVAYQYDVDRNKLLDSDHAAEVILKAAWHQVKGE